MDSEEEMLDLDIDLSALYKPIELPSMADLLNALAAKAYSKGAKKRNQAEEQNTKIELKDNSFKFDDQEYIIKFNWQEMGAIPVVKEVREKRSLSKPKSLIDSAQDQKLADMYKINRSLTKLAGKANKLFDENEDDLTDNSANLPSDLKSAIRRLKEELNQRTHIVFSFASPVYIPFKVKEQVLPQLNYKQEFEQIK